MYFVWSAIKAIEADAFMDLLQNRHEAKICMLCYVMLCYVTLRYVMLCYDMLLYEKCHQIFYKSW